MRIEARQMFRSNGLIDDLVLYGKPEDYLRFAETVGKAINSGKPELMSSDSNISVEIDCDEEDDELFTSLQNKENDYYSMDDWNNRTILRVFGTRNILEQLQAFLVNLASKGEGYSYISEYSETNAYSSESPEWRLRVEIT